MDLITVCAWIIMGCLNCLYVELTWKFKREKIIDRLSEKSSPMVRDIIVNLLDNRMYIIIAIEFLLAPVFFITTFWDTIKLILGKSELSDRKVG